MSINYWKWSTLYPNVLILGGYLYVVVAYDDPARQWIAGNCVRPLTSDEAKKFDADCG